MINRTPNRTPGGFRRNVSLVTPLSALRSTSPAKQDDGDDEETKDNSFQQIRASTDATGETVDKLATLLSDGSELEKKFQKDRLSVINRETWIAHKAKYRCYKQNNGRRSLVESICCERYEFCVRYIVKNISVEHFKTLDNMVVENIFDLHYDVDIAGNYNVVLSALAMKEGPFNRTKVENYATDFTEALLIHPTFSDPFAGGTTEELINVIFIAGLQPMGFRQRVSQFGSKEVDTTYEAIRKVLPRYQESVDMGFVHPDLPVAKATTQPNIHKPKASMSFKPKVVYDCNHCKQPGHDQHSCPFKDECLQCKTKAHRYWKPGCPLFDKWAAGKDAARAKAGQPPFKANSAIVQPAALDEVAALRLEILELQKAMKVKLKNELLQLKIAKLERLEKKILLDSGANISVIAHPSHVDFNTIPSCRRADKSSGVETADKTVMPIAGDGIILGCDGVICHDASHSLVSQSQFTNIHDAVVISDSVGAVAYRKDAYVKESLKELNEKCCEKKNVLFTSHVNNDHLYETTSHHVPVVSETTSVMNTLSLHGALRDMTVENATTEDTECETANWAPDEAAVERHALAVEALTYGALYFTAQCPRLQDR